MCSFLVVGDRFVDMEADQYSSVYRWVLSLEGGSIPILRRIPLAALLPIAAALYTMFTPGYLFADIRNGYEILSVYLIGIMAILLLQDRYFVSMLFLPIALSVTYIGFMVGIFSKPAKQTI